MLISNRKERLGLALTPELVSEVDQYASLFLVSRSQFFEDAVRIHLKRLEKKIENTETLAA